MDSMWTPPEREVHVVSLLGDGTAVFAARRAAGGPTVARRRSGARGMEAAGLLGRGFGIALEAHSRNGRKLSIRRHPINWSRSKISEDSRLDIRGDATAASQPTARFHRAKTSPGPRNAAGSGFAYSRQGVALSGNHNSLRANSRGPPLLEDFILPEKVASFDHERIPERIVHARATGVHGFVELTASLN